MADESVVSLTIPGTQAHAEILVAQGLNCFRLCLEHGGRSKEILWSEDGFGQGRSRASSGGMPILFPFAGRIAKGQFHWEQQPFDIPDNDGRGNAIHGFAYTRPWTVTERQANELAAVFRSDRVPELTPQWPAKHELHVRYRLSVDALEMELVVTNLDTKPLPYSLGLHPYFTTADQERTEIQAPLREQWELNELIPTGNRIENTLATQLRNGMAAADLELDDVFGCDTPNTDSYLASIRSRTSEDDREESVELSWSSNFSACVLYTPGHREAICIEPYSALPDMFAMTAASHEPSLQRLASGESDHYNFAIKFKSS